MPSNIASLRSAAELAAAIGRRELSAQEVVQTCLDRIAATNGEINAICTLNPRAEEAAKECDRQLASGAAPRPLEGVPFVAKDVLHTAGLRTTFGTKLRENFVPDEDAISVARLKDAGAILIGKANTPEFAHDVDTSNAVFGATKNPHKLEYSAGGSSGGTAAAIAAGMVPIGLGTDLGGSIRTPASFCGIVGLRPAPGRVPVYPSEFGWDTLVAHVHGPMAATVGDVALMQSVLAGPDDRDPMSLPQQAPADAPAAPRRVAYTPDLGGVFYCDPEVAEMTRAAAYRFAQFGWEVQDDCFDASDIGAIVTGTRAYAMVARYAEIYEKKRGMLTPPMLRQVGNAADIDVKTVAKAERLRTQYWQRVRVLFESYDYLMLPVCGVAGFRREGERPPYEAFFATYGISVVGLPAISVPCGTTHDGLPVGLQIVGRRFHEDRVLEAAAMYENSRSV